MVSEVRPKCLRPSHIPLHNACACCAHQHHNLIYILLFDTSAACVIMLSHILNVFSLLISLAVRRKPRDAISMIKAGSKLKSLNVSWVAIATATKEYLQKQIFQELNRVTCCSSMSGESSDRNIDDVNFFLFFFSTIVHNVQGIYQCANLLST